MFTDRCMKWVINTRNDKLLKKSKKIGVSEATKNMRLCSHHFQDNQYINSERYCITN